jgi:hypothetical protein
MVCLHFLKLFKKKTLAETAACKLKYQSRNCGITEAAL